MPTIAEKVIHEALSLPELSAASAQSAAFTEAIADNFPSIIA